MSNKPYKEKEGKLRFDLIPPEMDKAMAEVCTFGIEKLKKAGVTNPERNWEQGIPLMDHIAALKRHLNSWEMGDDINEESNLNHMKHVLWHVAAVVTQIDRVRLGLDNRPSIISVSNRWTTEQLINEEDLKEIVKAIPTEPQVWANTKEVDNHIRDLRQERIMPLPGMDKARKKAWKNAEKKRTRDEKIKLTKNEKSPWEGVF